MPKKTKKLDHRFFSAFVDYTYDCEYFRILEGRYVYVTPSCLRVTGYHPEAFYKDSGIMEKIVHPKSLDSWRTHHQRMIEGGKLEELDFRIITKKGDERWIRHICQPVQLIKPGYRGIRSSNSDITLRKQLENDLKQAALHDYLTGLMNRRFMMKQIQNQIYQHQRNQKAFSLILCDIDGFKTINDTFGHDAGDEVLVQMASLFKSMLRKQDFVGRWGGEEFMIVLPGTPLIGAREVAEKIRMTVESGCTLYEGHEIKVTMSFGVHEYDCGEIPDPCIRKADVNLYQAKLMGKNTIM